MIVLGLGVVVLTVVVNVAVVAALRSQADSVLKVRAQAAASTVSVDSSGQLIVQDARADSALDVGTWIFDGQRILENPAGGAGLDATALSLVGRGRVFEQSDQGAPMRWYAEPVLSDGEQVGTVVTSLSLSPYRATTRVMLGGTTVLAILLIAAVWLALRSGVGKALQPVADMTHQGAQWSVDDVDRRFGSGHRPEELEDLARTLDGLLDRLASALRREERLSAEVSHELRTPIARMQAELELLQEHQLSAEEVQQGLASLQASTSELSQILEILMDTARPATGPSMGRCSVRAVVDGVLAGRHVTAEAPAVTVAGDGAAGVDARVFERALSPIFDNAFRHAESRVDVSISAEPEVISVTIRDDGPGIHPDAMQQIFEPGFRGSVEGDHGAAGLGLALSRRLLAAIGGSVEALPAGHGSCLVVCVPAA